MEHGKRCADRLGQKLALLEGLDLEELGRQSGFVRRRARKLDLHAFVKSLLGLAGAGAPTLTTVVDGMKVVGHQDYSPQALAKRVRCRADVFLSAVLGSLFRHRARTLMQQGLLSTFNRILIQDSTVVAVPDRYAPAFPGCVNQTRRSFAQLKLQCTLALDSLSLCQVSLSGFTRNDQAASADILDVVRRGDLVVRDLGYFALDVLAELRAREAHFLSRLHHGTRVYDAKTGNALDLPRLLAKHRQLDQPVLLGEVRLPARLVAMPVPQAVADRRRRQAHQHTHGHRPSRDSLFLMNWNLFITSVPQTLWSAETVRDVYRLRWTIEIVFKAWTSHLRLNQLNTHSESMLRLSVMSRLLFCALTLDVWADLEWQSPAHRHASVLRVARVLFDCAALITCLVFRCSPAQLLDDLLCAHAFHRPRADRQNTPQGFTALRAA